MGLVIQIQNNGTGSEDGRRKGDERKEENEVVSWGPYRDDVFNRLCGKR
jgi:hypothetical protein